MKNVLIQRIADGSTYGKLMILVGVLIACPLVILIFYPSEVEYAAAFAVPALVSVAQGVILCIVKPTGISRRKEWQSLMQEGSAPVLFTWAYAFLLGAIPFVVAGELPFIPALFEAVSGWTTTGLTVVDVSKLPHIFLFHRSFMQFSGGMGFVIMIAMIIKGKQSVSLYSAEGHPDKIRPSLRETARTIFRIDMICLVIGSTAFTILGMPLFDSICHTMSALSTAGFSTKNNSILAYHSIPIEIVMVILMIIGASNFSVLDQLFRGRFLQALRDSEVRFMWIIMIICSILAGIDLYRYTDGSFLFSLHRAIFGVVTTFSTTGYSTMDYSNWPAFSLCILMILMIIGGCTGSTAGGIKMYRAYLLARIAVTNFRRRMNPERNVILLTYRKHEAEQTLHARQMEDVVGFVFLYGVVLVIGIMLTTLTAGCSLQTAAFEFTSALGTVGLSNGLTSATLPGPALIVLMIGMILGRLEVTIVFVGLYSLIRKVERRI